MVNSVAFGQFLVKDLNSQAQVLSLPKNVNYGKFGQFWSAMVKDLNSPPQVLPENFQVWTILFKIIKYVYFRVL